MPSVFSRQRLGLLLIFALAVWPVRAQETQVPPTEVGEEPDYFFLTGGPYTQKKNSPQIIWANQWFLTSGGVRTRAYTGAGRFEWGLTDRWEEIVRIRQARLRAAGQARPRPRPSRQLTAKFKPNLALMSFRTK